VTWDSEGSISITASDMPSCSLVGKYQYFRRICSLHLLKRGLLCPEGRSSEFVRNVVPIYQHAVLHFKRLILTQSEISGVPPSKIACCLSLCISTTVCRCMWEMRWSFRLIECSASCSGRFIFSLPMWKHSRWNWFPIYLQASYQ
jgi:hypothetical protein